MSKKLERYKTLGDVLDDIMFLGSSYVKNLKDEDFEDCEDENTTDGVVEDER